MTNLIEKSDTEYKTHDVFIPAHTERLYAFGELKPSVQEKVLEARRIEEAEGMDLNWWKDQVTTEIEEVGWGKVMVWYSLGYSQGDGLCFEGTLNLERYLKEHKLLSKYRLLNTYADIVKITATHAGNYYHENSVSLDYELFDSDLSQRTIKSIEVVLTEFMTALELERVELCQKYAKEGYAEIEHTLSEEQLIETIKINETYFNIDGEVI